MRIDDNTKQGTGITMLNALTIRHFEQMGRLEAAYYGSDYITPPAEAFAWYRQYPYTVVAAADGDEVAGFVNLFPVTDAVFDAIRAGVFNDSLLGTEDIVDIAAAPHAPLNMFLSCIVVDEPYRRLGLTRRLLKAAIAPYRQVFSRCQWIITDNVTEAGAAFSERYGFSLVCRSAHDSSVYIQRFASFVVNVCAAE